MSSKKQSKVQVYKFTEEEEALIQDLASHLIHIATSSSQEAHDLAAVFTAILVRRLGGTATISLQEFVETQENFVLRVDDKPSQGVKVFTVIPLSQPSSSVQ